MAQPLHKAKTPLSAGIAGAGLSGRLLALTLANHGWRVTLFDQDTPQGSKSCGYAGAGMLSPFSELEQSEPLITLLGLLSIPLWQTLVDQLRQAGQPVFLQQAGTLAIAHPLDLPDLKRFACHIQQRTSQGLLESLLENTPCHAVDRQTLEQLEPTLAGRFAHGVLLPDEGQIDNRQLFEALGNVLETHPQISWRSQQSVQCLSSGTITTNNQVHRFDWAIDCRGLGSKPEWHALRGVRGELLRVHAPDVELNRPIRLMHPRHPIYVVPRENQHFLIGATSIESDDPRPMTVQSAFELLSAACTVHPGFSEASILELTVQCRPALPDHLPQLQLQPGLLRLNGLYRHGFLISPSLVFIAHQLLEISTYINTLSTQKKQTFAEIWHQENDTHLAPLFETLPSSTMGKSVSTLQAIKDLLHSIIQFEEETEPYARSDQRNAPGITSRHFHSEHLNPVGV